MKKTNAIAINPTLTAEFKKALKADGITVEVSVNVEKFGIQLTFSGKPCESVRNDMKAHGFKFNPKNGLWWAVQSDETIAYANSFVSKKNAVKGSNQAESKNPPKEVVKEEPKVTAKVMQTAAEPKKSAPKKTAKSKSAPVEEFVILTIGKTEYKIPKAIADGVVMPILTQFAVK